jgi:hypothetical protein
VAPLLTATDDDDWADQVEKASGMITSEEEDDADLYSRPKQPVFCQPPATQSRTEDVDDADLYSRPVRPIFCPPPTSPLSSPIRPYQGDTPEPEPVDNGFRDYGVDHNIELYDIPCSAIVRPPPRPDDNDHKMDLDSREVSLGHASSPMRGVRFGGQERGTEQASPMEDVRGEHSPFLDRDVPMEDEFREKAMTVYHQIPLSTSGTTRTTYPAPAPPQPQKPDFPAPQQKLPSPPYIPSYKPFDFQTPGLQQFFTPRDFGTAPESSSPSERGLFYRPPASPSPLGRFPRINKTKKTEDALSCVYRTIYAVEPEQERLTFTPVRTVFKMAELFKQEEEETQDSGLTQLLEWMKRYEQHQADAEQKERERDETLRKIRDEQRLQARKLEELARKKPVSYVDAEKKKAELDKAREDELNEMMARHRLFYEEAGLEVPDALLAATSNRNTFQQNDYGRQTDKEPKAEYVKPSVVGYLDPMAPHARWDGQITDGTNTYVSFAGWLDHLQQVLEQKPTQQWKVAVLDTATLSCLRGRALA